MLPVKIPYGDRQRVSNDARSRLFSLTADELDDLWDEDPALAEATEFYLPSGESQTIQRILAVEILVKMQEVYERNLLVCR